MIELNVCVICGTADNLGTELSITIEDQKVKVKICDQHADDTTPKAAREAYLAKKAEIDNIIAMAAKYGLHLQAPQSGNKIATIQSNQPAKPAPQNQQPKSANDIELTGDNVVSTRLIDQKMQSISGVSGSAGGYNVEKNSAHDLSSVAKDLPEGATDGKVQMSLVEGRGGQMMAIPSVRRDHLGTTTIVVNKGITDVDIQRRLKEQSQRGDNVHSFGPEGYTVHTCTMCKGSLMIVNKGQRVVCPKCGGTGILNS